MATAKNAAPSVAGEKEVQVVATEKGYHNALIEAGQKFFVPESLVPKAGAKTWFRPVNLKDDDSEVI